MGSCDCGFERQFARKTVKKLVNNIVRRRFRGVGRPASGTEKPRFEAGRTLMMVKKAIKTAILEASTAQNRQKLKRKWSGAGSNRRHRPFQGRALPTELPDLGTLMLPL